MRRDAYTVEEEKEFFLDFLGESEEYRDDGLVQADEIEAMDNYMVTPPRMGVGGDSLAARIVLKDTETHQTVETWLSKLLAMTLSPKGFVETSPIGREDAWGSNAVSGLLRYGFRRPGNFRSNYVTYKNAILFGQAVILPAWAYWEGPVTQIEGGGMGLFGEEEVTRVRALGVVQDDPLFFPIDIDDFYPFPGEEDMSRMLFCAHRYIIPEHKAWEMAESGRWSRAAVARAIGKADKTNSNSSQSSSSGHRYYPGNIERDKSWREGSFRSQHYRLPSSYKPLVAVEGWGEVPYRKRDGERWRRLTLLNGELVESRPMPVATSRRVPYCDFVMNPVQGRWRGVSPAIVNRYVQSFMDAMLICLAEGAVREVTAPVIYDPSSEVSEARLEAWAGPIAARGGPSAVGVMQYRPNLANGFAMYTGLKQMQQQSSGATGGLQGHGLGTKRFSANEAVSTFKQAMDRPTMVAELFEREYLPALGRMVFELYQQFLPSDQALADRVGVSAMVDNRMPTLANISGDFDIEFVGSSRIQDDQVKLQALTNIMQIFGSVPGAAPLFPWIEGLLKALELSQLRDLEAAAKNQQGAEEFIARSQLLSSVKSMQGPAAMPDGTDNADVPGIVSEGGTPFDPSQQQRFMQ